MKCHFCEQDHEPTKVTTFGIPIVICESLPPGRWHLVKEEPAILVSPAYLTATAATK